ncbi:ligand-binding sensor domain-containing protein [Flavobacterium sp. PL11]|uniref:ligand-binding sensor domain-containing protein n=1 Tax=Flavobacterium sp. PL11 TaxID=3071717 RepID=UPI002E07EEEB|nr:ligand-binding sensor domain-containing protein [Flavobacterium sp. PL11]
MKSKNLFITFALCIVLGCSKNSKHINNLDPTLQLQSDQIDSGSTNQLSNSLDQTDLNYSTEQLDNTKGLSNSSVNTIFQDSQNLLWIGTWDGLNRYDGNNFKIYRPELNNENSLTNQVILKIDEDHLGYIWILTMHGINRYDKKVDLFKRYYFTKKNNRPLSESEFNIAINPAKKVYCAVKNWGIGYYNGQNFIQLRTENLPKKAVKKMEFASSDKLILMYDDNTLYALDVPPSNKNKNHIIKAKLLSSGVQSFEIVSKDKIGMVSNDGIASFYSLINNARQIINIGIVESLIGKVADGLVFAAKRNNIIINNLGKIVSKPWLKNVQSQKTTTLYQGSENIIWTGTDGDGLFKIYPLKKAFNLISKLKVPELDGGIVRSFVEIKGNSFWVGTKGKGLFKFSDDFYQKPESELQYSIYNEYNSGINNAVFMLLPKKRTTFCVNLR